MLAMIGLVLIFFSGLTIFLMSVLLAVSTKKKERRFFLLFGSVTGLLFVCGMVLIFNGVGITFNNLMGEW